MSKYTDLVVLKTNKPNSKKVIDAFLQEFGYSEYGEEAQENKGRTLAINFIIDDIEDEIQSFSREADNKKAKFTVQYMKVTEDKTEQHLLRTLEIVDGKVQKNEIDNVITALVEKENEQFIKDQKTLFAKSKDSQPLNNENKQKKTNNFNHRNKHVNTKETVYEHKFPQTQEISEDENKPVNKSQKFSQRFDKNNNKNTNPKSNKKTTPKNNHKKIHKPKEKVALDPAEQQKINNQKANENNPNHPAYKGDKVKTVAVKPEVRKPQVRKPK
jgi:hypothetical protein